MSSLDWVELALDPGHPQTWAALWGDGQWEIRAPDAHPGVYAVELSYAPRVLPLDARIRLGMFENVDEARDRAEGLREVAEGASGSAATQAGAELRSWATPAATKLRGIPLAVYEERHGRRPNPTHTARLWVAHWIAWGTGEPRLPAFRAARPANSYEAAIARAYAQMMDAQWGAPEQRAWLRNRPADWCVVVDAEDLFEEQTGELVAGVRSERGATDRALLGLVPYVPPVGRPV